MLKKGEKDAGVILVITTHNGRFTRLWERMPQLDGSRRFMVSKEQDAENNVSFGDYLARRLANDPDCWAIELDIENAERFVAAPSG